MIGGIVGKLLDTSAAKHDAETWERNYNRLLQEHAAALGENKRLKQELHEKNLQVADFRMAAADGNTRRLAADNSHLRLERAKLGEATKDLIRERDAAVKARGVAESALAALSRTPPAGDAARREADQHRANAQRLSDELAAMRLQVETFEADIAALREQLETCGREHPS